MTRFDHHAGPIHTISLAAGCLALILSTQNAVAVELDYSLGYEAEHDSNVQFNSNGGNELINSFFIDADLRQTGAAFEAEVETEIEYNHYSNNSFDDDLRATVTANGLWRIMPDRFHWNISNNLVQTPIDIQGERNPGNQQDSNLFTTGPDFVVRVGAADRLIIGGRYAVSDFRETDTDSERITGSLSYQRNLSGEGLIGVRVQSTKIDFDAPLSEDYDRHEGYLEYVYGAQLGGQAESRLSINAGLSKLDFDRRDSLTNPLLRLEWALNRPNGINFSVRAENSTSDSADLLGGVIGALDPTNSTDLTNTTDPFEQTRGQIDLSRSWGEFNAGVALEYGVQNFDEEDLDQDYYRFGVNASYPITPLMDIRVAASIEQRDFEQRDQVDDFVNASISWGYQRTAHWRFELDVLWRDRDSSVPLQTADSLVGVFRISYQR